MTWWRWNITEFLIVQFAYNQRKHYHGHQCNGALWCALRSAVGFETITFWRCFTSWKISFEKECVHIAVNGRINGDLGYCATGVGKSYRWKGLLTLRHMSMMLCRMLLRCVYGQYEFNDYFKPPGLRNKDVLNRHVYSQHKKTRPWNTQIPLQTLLLDTCSTAKSNVTQFKWWMERFLTVLQFRYTVCTCICYVRVRPVNNSDNMIMIIITKIYTSDSNDDIVVVCDD